MIQLEEAEQHALFTWASYFPSLRWMYAIPNGGRRSKAVAGKLKAGGVKAGVLDIFLPEPLHGFHGLYIEMKRSRGSTSVTPNQKEFKAYAESRGYKCVICYGTQEAIDAINEYMGPLLTAGAPAAKHRSG